MAAQIRSNMATILPLILAQIRSVTGFPEERVNPWVGEEAPHLQADQDIVVLIRGFTPDPAYFAGGGRYTRLVKEKLEVRIRTRLMVDHPGSASQWLLDATLGHLQLRDKVANALDGFLPANEDGDVLVSSEITMESEPGPKKDAPRTQPIDWGEERLVFTVGYLWERDLPDALPAEPS